MHLTKVKFLAAISVVILISIPVFGQSQIKPDTLTFESGGLQLKGLLWKPAGKGPFPAVMYNHGSEASPEKFLSKTPFVFLERGYAFFAPFRRGQGLSKGQGKYIVEQLDSVSAASGTQARFAMVIKLHETSQLQDQLAALEYLKKQPAIDASRIAIIGISFGGVQTMLLAQKASGIKAALNFAGAAMMWEKSPEVAAWMQKGIADVKVPVFFIQAENDFSIKPSLVLSEEMKKLGKPYALKIYPPRGTKPMEGHTLIDDDAIWAPDVFPQLDKWVGKK